MSDDLLVVVPTEEQQRVLNHVARIYLVYKKWPSWSWLEETLEREGLDAWPIIANMPKAGPHSYGFLRHFVMPPAADSQIWLLIAGLRHVQPATQLVADFCGLVGALGTIRSQVYLDPFAVERPVASWQEVVSLLRPPMRPDESVLALLSNEPATWQCKIEGDRNGEWSIELWPHVRRFAGIHTVEEYLDRLAYLWTPSSVAEEPPLPSSPFSLPAAIDYLDAVWRLRFEEPLVAPPGLERSARLAFNVSTREEADSALSALAEVLKSLKVPSTPGVDGHPLQRIVPYLEGRLPSEAIDRVREAVDQLEAARKLRAAAQHVGAEAKAITAYGVLGLSYPVANWAEAWNRIQAVAAHAFDVIREELQASDAAD